MSSIRRRRSGLLPIAILTGSAAAIGCGCGESYDGSSGCCVTYCNGAEPMYYSCDTGAHAGEECTPPNQASGRETGSPADTAACADTADTATAVECGDGG